MSSTMAVEIQEISISQHSSPARRESPSSDCSANQTRDMFRRRLGRSKTPPQLRMPVTPPRLSHSSEDDSISPRPARERVNSRDYTHSYDASFGAGNDDMVGVIVARYTGGWLEKHQLYMFTAYIFALLVLELMVAMALSPSNGALADKTLTVTNFIHFAITLIYLHWMKGACEEDQGDLEHMTLWEQIEATSHTGWLRFGLRLVPILICWCACSQAQWELKACSFNALVLFFALLGKFPCMNGVRLFGINADPVIDKSEQGQQEPSGGGEVHTGEIHTVTIPQQHQPTECDSPHRARVLRRRKAPNQVRTQGTPPRLSHNSGEDSISPRTARERVNSRDFTHTYDGAYDMVGVTVARSAGGWWGKHQLYMFTAYILALLLVELMVAMALSPADGTLADKTLTVTNFIHFVVTLIYLHWMKGGCEEGYGDLEHMTLWEQIEATPHTQWLRFGLRLVPIVICWCACSQAQWELKACTFNAVVSFFTMLGKFPFMNGVRLLGINADPFIDKED